MARKPDRPTTAFQKAYARYNNGAELSDAVLSILYAIEQRGVIPQVLVTTANKDIKAQRRAELEEELRALEADE